MRNKASFINTLAHKLAIIGIVAATAFGIRALAV